MRGHLTDHVNHQPLVECDFKEEAASECKGHWEECAAIVVDANTATASVANQDAMENAWTVADHVA